MKRIVLSLTLFAGMALATFAGVDAQNPFPWRGCMIDVSRHYFPMSFLYRQVDILSEMGINRLHLHLVDAAGWRMEIKSYPELTARTAYRTQSDWDKWWVGRDRNYATKDMPDAYGGYYTQDELRGLVSYAAGKGITVVPEIEMPGHSEELIYALPHLNCAPVVVVQEAGTDGVFIKDELLDVPNTGDVCPANKMVYEFFENVLTEVMDVFPSEYIHIGGDEASKANWDNCPRCEEMREKLGGDNEVLQAYMIRRVTKWLNEHGRKAIVWDEAVEGLKYPDTGIDIDHDGLAVMNWRDIANAYEAVAMGYKVILTPSAYYYLDYYQDVPKTQPRAIGGFLPLERVYSFDPQREFEEEDLPRVLGVQGNLWTEYVETPEHAEYMLYPRMYAIAEVGKAPAKRLSWEKFRKKALKETARLRKRGINAFDLSKEAGPRPESLTPIKHAALGAKVNYYKPYSYKYKAGGESALTDGLRGNYEHGDGRWQGFCTGKCLDVLIDLGEVRDLHEIYMDFMQNSGAWIYLPKLFMLSASEDGEGFKYLMGREEPKRTNVGTEFERYYWKGASRARYLRIEAEATGEGEWIFTDEVVVN